MGCRLHVAKQYKVQYSLDGYFNWGQDVIADILNSTCKYHNIYDDRGEIEIPNEEFENMIERLKAMTDEEFEEIARKQECNDAGVSFREYVIEKLSYLYDQRDKDNDYVVFVWF